MTMRTRAYVAAKIGRLSRAELAELHALADRSLLAQRAKTAKYEELAPYDVVIAFARAGDALAPQATRAAEPKSPPHAPPSTQGKPKPPKP